MKEQRINCHVEVVKMQEYWCFAVFKILALMLCATFICCISKKCTTPHHKNFSIVTKCFKVPWMWTDSLV